MVRYFPFFTVLVLLSWPAHAEWDAAVETRTQSLYDDNRDLGTDTQDSRKSQSLDVRLKLHFKPMKDIILYTEVRGGVLGGDGLVDEETGEFLREDSFLQLRELWVRRDNLFAPGLSLQGGRQRIRERSGLWWNNNLDALRALYDKKKFKGFAGFGQNLGGYSTDDAAFSENDEDRFHAFAEGSWALNNGLRFEMRGLYEHDYSGAPVSGSVLDMEARDDFDGRLFWLGARLADDRRSRVFTYRADLIGVVGAEDTTATTAGPGGTRIAGATTGADVAGWAFDGAVAARAPLPLDPVFQLGYAYGSGDGDAGDGQDHAFRQSALKSNISRFAGASQSLHNYGEALRPELSNLHILSAGASLYPNAASDLTIRYLRYWRDEGNGNLRGDRLTLDPVTDDADIGQAVDAAYNIDLQNTFGLSVPGAERVFLRTAAGVFRAGDAYGPAAGEYVWRGLAELQLNF